MKRNGAPVLLVLAVALPAAADPHINWGRFKPTLEVRSWFEHRDGAGFGLTPEYSTALLRTRFNLEYRASDFLRFGGTVQDAHAPGYPKPRPGTANNPTELHEAYLDFGKPGAAGWGGHVGRKRVFFGSQNLIGLPEWSNAGRTYDGARLFWQNAAVHLEALLVSSVKFNPSGFDTPVLGDRVWGTYSTFNQVVKGGKLDVFLLRHDQNRPGGFTGPGSLGTFSYGARVAAPISKRLRYDLEGIGQAGHIGPLPHRAFGYNAQFVAAKLFAPNWDLVFESKYASGTPDPATARRSATFDQLYPANHDRFGHADLLGFRNLIAFRWINRIRWGTHTTIQVAYTNNWLAHSRDALYDATGRVLGRSPLGTAGRHVGQEAAIYTLHRIGHIQLGAAFAYWWTGPFVQQTTLNVSPRYYYLHTGFVF